MKYTVFISQDDKDNKFEIYKYIYDKECPEEFTKAVIEFISDLH
jgi:hypothetical protein